MNSRIVRAAWGVLFCTGSVLAQGVGGQLGAPPDLAALVEAIGQRWLAGGVPGASVVVIEDGQVTLVLPHGMADVALSRPVTEATVFRAGSISKTLTAVALMQLVERGLVDLDASMTDRLPEWSLRGASETAHPPRLAHLLEHTSGLDDIRYRHYLLEGAAITLAEALPMFGPYRARWPPGSGTSYSNAGPIVAGRLLEVATGTSFDEFMARSVTGPMAMPSARWRRDPSQSGVLAASYQANARTPEPFVETPGRPSGSLSATAPDLARLALMLIGRGRLDGRQVLKRSSVERMERPATSLAAQHGAPIGWGLGLRPDVDGRAVFFGHDGSIDGFVARFAYAPDLRSGYVVMANLASDAAIDVSTLVRRYLERDLPVPTPAVVPVSPDDRKRWSGQYQSITPRQELLRAVIGLTQWEGARFDGDVLSFERARWRHVGQGQFQKEGAAAPSLLFIDTADGVQAHMHDGAKRNLGGVERTVKVGAIALSIASLLAGLVALPVWTFSAARGRLAARGGASLRLWPLAALALALAAPLSVLVLIGSGDLALLGRPNAWAWLSWTLSWLAPAASVAALTVLWRRRGQPAGRLAWTLAWTQTAMALVVVAWFSVHGWIGLHIWDA